MNTAPVKSRVRFQLAAVSVALVLCATGCEPEPTHEGKTVAEWGELTEDPDHVRRENAVNSLVAMRDRSPRAEQHMREEFARTTGGRRLTYGLLLWPEFADETFATAEALIRADADAGRALSQPRRLRELVAFDPPRAAAVLGDDLEYAREKAAAANDRIGVDRAERLLAQLRGAAPAQSQPSSAGQKQ